MIFGILAWCLAGAFVLAASYLTHRPLRTDRPSLNAATFLFLTVFVTTTLLLLPGLAGGLWPGALAVVSSIGLAGLLLWRQPRQALFQVRSECTAVAAQGLRWWQALPNWLRWLTAFAVLASVIRFAFLIWVLPPFTWDSLTYHLTNVAEWTQSGLIAPFDTPVDRIWSPANYEVFAAWFTVFLDHDVIVEASGLPAYLLACLAVYAIGRTLGLKPAGSLVAALGYASTPALLLATTATKNDPIMAALYLVLLALGLDLAIRPGTGTERNRPGQVVLMVCIWLLALGTKPYILHLTPGLLLAWLLATIGWKSEPGWQALPGSIFERLRSNQKGFRLAAGWVLAAGLLLGFFWYVRNWMLMGNPFFPYGLAVESTQIIPASGAVTRLDLTNFVENLNSFVNRFGDKQARITPDLPNTTGWGWVAYGLGLPALAWGLVRRPWTRVLFAGFAVSLLVLFFSSPNSPWNMRYAIWFPALLALAVGFAFDGVLTVVRPAHVGFGLLFAACSAANFVMMLNYNWLPPSSFEAMLALPALQRESARLSLKVPWEYAAALDIVPREDILGYNVHHNGFIYPLYRADYSQHLAYVPIPEGSTCDSIAAAIEAHGTRYLFVAPEHTEDWILALLNECATEKLVLRERVRGLYVVKRD